MDYRVHITDESGSGIAGTIYFYDADGHQNGTFDVPVGGANVPPDLVAAAASFQVAAPGYVGYAVLQLNDWNSFTMVKEGGSKIVLLVAAVIALLLAGKLLKG